MSSKPDHATQGGGDALESVLGGGIIELMGPDAGAFAQAQLMSDVRLLGDGHWQWSGWLTPKGRVVALGALLRIESTRFWLILSDHPAELLAAALRRYVFRSKVTLSARTDLTAHGAFAAPRALDSAAHGGVADIGAGCVLLDCSGAVARTLLLGSDADCRARLGARAIPAASAAAWAVEDLAHGWPRLDPQAAPGWTPQMLGLDRLRAFSVSKGCYPGQEIVARTHFLGQARRKLRRLCATSAVPAGSPLLADGNAVGDVLCSASDGARHEALAVLDRELPFTGLSSLQVHGAISLHEFDDGLAR